MKKVYQGNSKKGGVYQIRNLQNGKVYIGSAKCFQVRASQHISRLKQGKHHNRHLLASWNKWGADAFLFEVLEVVDGTTEQRRKKEQEYINSFLREWNLCYNLHKKTIIKEKSAWSNTPAKTRKLHSNKMKERWENPEFRKRRSEQTKKLWSDKDFRKKITDAQKASWSSIEQRKLQSQRRKKYLESNEIREKISQQSKERWNDDLFRKQTSKKISKAKQKQWSNTKYKKRVAAILTEVNGKKVAQVCKKTDKIIKVFPSMLQAGKALNINFRNISAVCKGRRKTAGGYKWKVV